jgi:hypothetical protein
VDALILPDRETRIVRRAERIDIALGECAVLVQTKDGRLGVYLMGQDGKTGADLTPYIDRGLSLCQ